MSELPPRDSFVAEVAYIALRDELNLEITSLRTENSRLSALAGKMREVGNRILAAGQGTDYPDSCQAPRDALSLTPADMGEWGRKEEVEKTESSIADTPDQNEWSVVLALLDELSTLRAKLAEVERAGACDVCGGTGEPASLRVCICNGTGRANVAVTSLRTMLYDVEMRLAEVEKERDLLTRECATLTQCVADWNTSYNVANETGELMRKSLDSAKARIEELETALGSIRDYFTIPRGLGAGYQMQAMARQALAKKGAE